MIGVPWPPWALSVSSFRNGQPLDSKVAEGYVLADSLWNAGDEVRGEYEMRIELLRHGSRAESRAVKFGPWILGASEESDPAFFGEGRDRNIARVKRLARNPADRVSRTVRHLFGGYSGQRDVAQLLPVAGRGLGTRFGRWQIWLLSEAPRIPTGVRPRSSSDVGRGCLQVSSQWGRCWSGG